MKNEDNFNYEIIPGRTPIGEALSKHNFYIADILLKRDADINYVNSKNNNLFFYLYESNGKPLNSFTIEYLVKNGIDINWRKENKTFLDFLIEQNNEKFTEKYLKSISFNNNFIISILSDRKNRKAYTKHEFDTLINTEYKNIQISNEVIDTITKTNNMVFFDLILKYKITSSNDEILKSILHHSCKSKNIDFVKKLIDKKVDINCPLKDSLLTPLMELSFIDKKLKMKGILKRIYDMFELLINAGADINAKDSQGKTALMYIVETKKATAKLIKFLVKRGAKINELCNDGYSPIIYATKGNNRFVIKYLLEFGADTSVVSKDGKSLFIHASINGSLHIIKYLIENDIVNDLNCVDKNFDTPLIHAVRSKNVDVIKYLIEKGADVNYTNINDESALTVACYGRITTKNLKIIQYLIDYGANINKIYNFKNNSNYYYYRKYNIFSKDTTLNYAIRRKSFNLVKLLIDNGVDVNGKDVQGKTALYHALELEKRKINIVEYLIEHGANVNEIINDENETILFSAVIRSNDAIIKLLIDNGADINHKNKDNNIPLGIVTYKGKEADYFEMLINNNVDFEELNKRDGNSIFLNSLSNRNKTLFNYIMDIVDMGNIEIDINHRGAHQNTALMYAVKTNDIEIVSRVLEKNPDINVKNISLDTAFTLAMKRRNYKIMKLLIDNGAEIDNLNVQTNIDLLDSAIYSYRNVRFLLKNGLEINDYIINSKLSYGGNLLSRAVRGRNCFLIDFLLVNGANPYLNSDYNRLPIEELCYGGYYDNDVKTSEKIIESFIEKGFDINTKNNNGETLLFSFHSHNCSELKQSMIRYLIENQNADINIQNKDGISLLMLCVKKYSKIDLDTIQYLVEEKKCSLDLKDNNGNTILMHALNQSEQQFYEYFLDKCQDFEQKNNYGMNLLMSAVKNVNLETVKKLIEKGISINDVDNEGRNALFYILKDPSYVPVVTKVLALGSRFSNTIDNFKYLIENGIDINCEDSEGKTIIYYIDNNLDLMKFAVEHGADVHHLDHEGRTVLFYLNDLATTKYVISKGVDASIRDKNGNTAVFSRENLPISLLLYLVKQGADINEYSFRARSDYSFNYTFNIDFMRKAVEYNFNFDTPNLLDVEGDLEGNVKEVFLDYIITNIDRYEAKDFTDIIGKAMKKKLFDINRKNFLGDIPLIYIMRKIKEHKLPMNTMYNELLQSMIDHGVNINEVDDEGKTLLYHALNLSVDLTKTIYLKGVHIIYRNKQGEKIFNVKNIILHENCPDVIKREMIKFIQSQQPIDYKKKVDGVYPIFLAIEQNCYMVVKYLLSQGVQLICTNTKKETVMDVAKRIGDQAIIKLISEQKEWIEFSNKKEKNKNKIKNNDDNNKNDNNKDKTKNDNNNKSDNKKKEKSSDDKVKI